MMKFGFAIILAIFLANGVQARSLIECPYENNPGDLVIDELVSEVTSEVVSVQLPKNGRLSNQITCILIIDNENSAIIPGIMEGGIGFEFVEIVLKPEEGYVNYRIQVFAMPSSTTAETTSTATSNVSY